MSLLQKPSPLNIDGVYVDAVNGVTGTAWPIGTPAMPVNNLTDALTIIAARKLTKVFLVNPTDVLTLPNDVSGLVFTGIGQLRDIGTLDLNGKDVSSCIFNNLAIEGSFNSFISPVFRHCELNISFDGWAYFYDCLIFDIRLYDVAMGKGVLWNCYSDSNTLPIIFHTAGSKIFLVNYNGWLEIRTMVAGCITHILAGAAARIVLNNTNTGGDLSLYGNIAMYDTSAGTSIEDYTNRPKKEVPVNITAILASETNFLNLQYHFFTIDNLVLKCADPGANTVNVRLYQLVNGVLTNIQTFAITNANFATYFDINTMFGLKSLAGDNIKITVQATAGGPYAVAGSYCYRSA